MQISDIIAGIFTRSAQTARCVGCDNANECGTPAREASGCLNGAITASSIHGVVCSNCISACLANDQGRPRAHALKDFSGSPIYIMNRYTRCDKIAVQSGKSDKVIGRAGRRLSGVARRNTCHQSERVAVCTFGSTIGEARTQRSAFVCTGNHHCSQAGVTGGSKICYVENTGRDCTDTTGPATNCRIAIIDINQVRYVRSRILASSIKCFRGVGSDSDNEGSSSTCQTVARGHVGCAWSRTVVSYTRVVSARNSI